MTIKAFGENAFDRRIDLCAKTQSCPFREVITAVQIPIAIVAVFFGNWHVGELVRVLLRRTIIDEDAVVLVHFLMFDDLVKLILRIVQMGCLILGASGNCNLTVAVEIEVFDDCQSIVCTGANTDAHAFQSFQVLLACWRQKYLHVFWQIIAGRQDAQIPNVCQLCLATKLCNSTTEGHFITNCNGWSRAGVNEDTFRGCGVAVAVSCFFLQVETTAGHTCYKCADVNELTNHAGFCTVTLNGGDECRRGIVVHNSAGCSLGYDLATRWVAQGHRQDFAQLGCFIASDVDCDGLGGFASCKIDAARWQGATEVSCINVAANSKVNSASLRQITVTGHCELEGGYAAVAFSFGVSFCCNSVGCGRTTTACSVAFQLQVLQNECFIAAVCRAFNDDG